MSCLQVTQALFFVTVATTAAVILYRPTSPVHWAHATPIAHPRPRPSTKPHTDRRTDRQLSSGEEQQETQTGFCEGAEGQSLAVYTGRWGLGDNPCFLWTRGLRASCVGERETGKDQALDKVEGRSREIQSFRDTGPYHETILIVMTGWHSWQVGRCQGGCSPSYIAQDGLTTKNSGNT